MIICPNCSKENEDTYKYCLACGYPLPKKEPSPVAAGPEMTDCPHCGEEVPANFKFCGACGGPIAAAPPRVQRPASGAMAPTARAPESPPRSGGGLGREITNSDMSGDVESRGPSLGGQTVAAAKLIVIRPDGSEGTTIELDRDKFVVGRDSPHQTLASDPFLSPRHAEISHQGQRFTLKDLDSLNGIFYRIRGEVELEHGDFLRMGQELLEYHEMSPRRAGLALQR